MNRNWHGRAQGGLPILSAALLSAAGLMSDGVSSSAAAQTSTGASGNVIVDYDVLNALPPKSAPAGSRGYGATIAPPVYPPYGTMRPGVLYAAPFVPGLAPGLAAPPPSAPTSVLTMLGPDGRPITPIRLRQPGSAIPNAPEDTDPQVAAVEPPGAPTDVPSEVPMLEPTPDAPAPAETAAPPATPVVETPAPAPEAPAAEQPTEQAAEQPAEEQPAQEPAAQDQATREQPAATPAEAPAPAEGDAAATDTEEQPTEEAAAEPAPAPDTSQPAPPIPQGGVRIVFPVDLNEVPPEANAALDDLAAQMQADESMRIQIMCYASGTEDTESKARRRSLARCINIRQYLFKKDVRTTRMDVRALGLKSEGQPADRVDIVPANS